MAWIQHPFREYLPWLPVTTLIPAALLLLVLGSAPVGIAPRILAPVITYALFLGTSLLILRLRYPPFSVDLESGTVRMSRHTLPISSVRNAWRRHYTGAGQGFLSYRFHSALGPSVRVRVAGRSLSGLKDEGRRLLARFITAAPIETPAAPVTRRGWERVGAAELLAELPRLDLDLLVLGVDEESLRADRKLDGLDPEPPIADGGADRRGPG